MSNKIAGFYRSLQMAAKNPQTQRAVLGTGIGTLLAALENKYIADGLPGPLKHINLGIGGMTGAAATLGGRTALATALLSVPIKQMGLFGIGSLEKSRQQQRDLMGLQLDRAKVDLDAALTKAKGQKGRDIAGALAALGLVAGGGALTAYTLDNKKYTNYMEQKEREKEERRKKKEEAAISGVKGKASRGRENLDIRIKVPASDAPASLLQSLVDLDEANKARTTFKLK